MPPVSAASEAPFGKGYPNGTGTRIAPSKRVRMPFRLTGVSSVERFAKDRAVWPIRGRADILTRKDGDSPAGGDGIRRVKRAHRISQEDRLYGASASRLYEPLLLSCCQADGYTSASAVEVSTTESDDNPCYGLRTHNAMERVLYHIFGRLPEPEATRETAEEMPLL